MDNEELWSEDGNPLDNVDGNPLNADGIANTGFNNKGYDDDVSEDDNQNPLNNNDGNQLNDDDGNPLEEPTVP